MTTELGRRWQDDFICVLQAYGAELITKDEARSFMGLSNFEEALKRIGS